MTTKKTTPKKDDLKPQPDNRSLLVFPTDKYGFTSGMRKEMLDAAARIKGDLHKYNLFMETLDIVKSHSTAKFNKERQDK